MAPGDFWALLERIGTLSTPVLLSFVLYGGYMRWWAWGWQLDKAIADHEKAIARLESEKESWKKMALENISITHKAVEEAERLRYERDTYYRRMGPDQSTRAPGSD